MKKISKKEQKRLKKAILDAAVVTAVQEGIKAGINIIQHLSLAFLSLFGGTSASSEPEPQVYEQEQVTINIFQ